VIAKIRTSEMCMEVRVSSVRKWVDRQWKVSRSISLYIHFKVKIVKISAPNGRHTGMRREEF